MQRFIKHFFRQQQRRPIYSAITFGGFTIGITASLFIYLWIHNELSYEKFHPDYERIYRVLTLAKWGDDVIKSPGSYKPLAKTIKADYPQIEYATYISPSPEDSPLQVEGMRKIEARESIVGDDFFHVFQGFEFVEGYAEHAFTDPSHIVISQEIARKLFGSQPALGKTITIDKYFRNDYKVAGVIKVPTLSHMRIEYLIHGSNGMYAMSENSWSNAGFAHVYLKLKKEAFVDQSFLSKISNHIGKYTSKSEKMVFQPLADIHLHSDYNSFYDRNLSSPKYIYIFSGMALIILVMASLNFAFLSVARSSERNTEIDIKKISGASRFYIAGQFLVESLLQSLVAIFLALVLVLLLLPLFNQLTGQEIRLQFSFILLVNLILITILVALVSGTYPSFYLSSLLPNHLLRGKQPTGSKTGFIHSLSTVQFAIAVFFIVAATIVIRQMDYIKSKDLGFDHKNIIVVPTGLWYNNQSFKEELIQNPNILGVSASMYAPIDFGWTINLAYTHQGRTDTLTTSLIFVDEDFSKTYNLQLVKGEFLKMDFNEYWKTIKKLSHNKKQEQQYAVSIPMVINESAEKSLGFEDPIGQKIGDKVIVGVVKDFHFRPLHHPIGPVVMTNDPENIMTMNIHISPENRAATIQYISETYEKHRDSREFHYQYFDDLLQEKYQSEARLQNITLVLTALAIIIASLGILGMSYFACDRRNKEIGIRKVNGAKTWEVMAMLNKDFVKWVAIAFIIASPIAWYAMNKWLQNFAYKTELSWWIFALAGVLALGIALLTVSFQSWKAANRNPIESLRYE